MSLAVSSDVIFQAESPPEVESLNGQIRSVLVEIGLTEATKFVDAKTFGKNYQFSNTQQFQQSMLLFVDTVGRAEAVIKCQKKLGISVNGDAIPTLCPESQMSFGSSEIKR